MSSLVKRRELTKSTCRRFTTELEIHEPPRYVMDFSFEDQIMHPPEAESRPKMTSSPSRYVGIHKGIYIHILLDNDVIFGLKIDTDRALFWCLREKF